MYPVPIGSGLGEIRGLTFCAMQHDERLGFGESEKIRVSESGAGQTARD
jgi:hypothetical protein